MLKFHARIYCAAKPLAYSAPLVYTTIVSHHLGVINAFFGSTVNLPAAGGFSEGY